MSRSFLLHVDVSEAALVDRGHLCRLVHPRRQDSINKPNLFGMYSSNVLYVHMTTARETFSRLRS